MSEYISVADTAKLVRKALKEHFPGTKFSVRSRSYAGGASIDVEWTDGPARPDVEKQVKRFQGASFDGMIDLKSYHTTTWEGKEVHFGADYVMCRRKMTRAFVEAIIAQFCQRFGTSPEAIRITGNEQEAWVDTDRLGVSDERWLQELLNQTDAKDMHRAYEAQEKRQQRERAEWEAGAPERERQAEQERKQHEAEARKREELRRQQQERERRRQQEQEQARQEQAKRESATAYKRLLLSSPRSARTFLMVPQNASRDQIMQAFRQQVKACADGKGGYKGDMDFLVQVKELALKDVAC